MRARNNNLLKAASRSAGGLSVRSLNVSLLALASLLVLLIGRGAGAG